MKKFKFEFKSKRAATIRLFCDKCNVIKKKRREADACKLAKLNHIYKLCG